MCVLSGSLVSSVLGTSAYAVSVPSTLPLVPRVHQSIDPEFKSWLETYAEATNPLEMSSEEFFSFVSTQDPVTASLLKIFRFQKVPPIQDTPEEKLKANADRSAILKEALIALSKEAELTAAKRHQLAPILATQYLNMASDEDDGRILKIIEADQSHTCSRKSYQLDLVKRSYLEKSSSEEIHALIRTAVSYDSLAHRRKLLDAVASNLPDARRSEFIEPLRNAGGNLPLLMRRHKWLQDAEIAAELHNPWISVNRLTRKRECASAAKEFTSVLKRGSSEISLENTMTTAVNVEQCLRSQKRTSAIAFWDEHKPIMKERFSALGELWADIRRGYLYWAGDENKEAQEIYETSLKAAEGVQGSETIQAKAIYTLGRIAEGGNDFPKAIDLYGQYVARFPQGEDFEIALNSMVVARAAKGQWKELIPSLKDFLDQQSLISVDQRPIGNMAFSLFWLGRAYLSLGQPDIAKEMWRRLAAEYYSTFYGAMGHFLLEQSSGRIYALEPSRVSGFKLTPFLADLTDKQRDVVSRTLSLLKVGLVEQARCESDELSVVENDKSTEKNPDKVSPSAQLVKALVLHASGSWLDAIRIFDSLPRSFRSGLPAGVERILFPRKYSDIVNRYAAKVGIDPDLVFAVMRQESVFAKEAQSPVGAMGLMQLMPTTASLELTKLPKNYVNHERKTELHALLSDGTNLFDPDVNITLGVHHLARLLDIYKSPVFALTSYNASPAATIKWKRTIATDDLLVFIERIPYKETRAYVKLIMRNYFYYKRWYGPSQVLQERHLESIAKDLIAMAKSPPKASNEKVSGD